MLEEGVAQAATLHVGLSSGNYLAPMDMVIGHCYSSPMRLVEDVTDYHLQYSRGKIIVNGKPGLGVTFREEILQKYRENYAVLS